MHTDSIFLTGTEHHRVFQSRILARYSVKVELVFMNRIGYWKVTANMPESAWNELVQIAETTSEVF